MKYRGYIARQQALVAQAERIETTPIPPDIDYGSIAGLSTEVREKLERILPRTLAQATRIPGVTPAAVSLLAVHLRRRRRGAAADGGTAARA